MLGSLLSAISERYSIVSFSKRFFRASRSWCLPERTPLLSIDRQEDGLILLINLGSNLKKEANEWQWQQRAEIAEDYQKS